MLCRWEFSIFNFAIFIEISISICKLIIENSLEIENCKLQIPNCKAVSLRLLVSIWFQILFHSPSGVLFTFPSRYLFTIGQYEYLALDLSRPDFQPDFSCLVVLKKKLGNCMVFRDTGLSPSVVRRSRRVLLNSTHYSLPLYRAAITSTYNAYQATPVCFKLLSCDSSNT